MLKNPIIKGKADPGFSHFNQHPNHYSNFFGYYCSKNYYLPT